MTCKNCNTNMPDDAAFCPECGTPVLAYANAVPQDSSMAQSKGIALGALEQNKFFNIFAGFINAMEQSGFFRKPLYWLYIIFAGLNILVPVYLLFMMISNDLLNRLGVGGFLIWLIIAFAGWMGFQLWWNRKDKITLHIQQGDDFFAIPLFSHYIQTMGEWLGMTLAIVGAGVALVAWIFLGGSGSGRTGFPIPLQGFGIAGVIIAPIIGFTIILISKVLSELYRALAAIANNTKQMANRM